MNEHPGSASPDEGEDHTTDPKVSPPAAHSNEADRADIDQAVLDQAAQILNDADAALAEEAAEVDSALAQAQSAAAEHLADLQRLQAEYVNYRKRVDRDRAVAGELATARAVEALIPVLDDIQAARDHGDLAEGPFASIAEKLESSLARLGWEPYGAKGEDFDPALHEALMTQASSEVSTTQISEVVQSGHRLGERILRPARVIVTQPE